MPSVPSLHELLEHPIVQAPMAGGGSTPELAAAVGEAGGLGFLAAGYKTPEAMYEEIKQLRRLTSRPFGVNLFMPQSPAADAGVIAVYRAQLAGEVSWFETPLGDPDLGTDDGYEAKLAILASDPVPAVSFTFGCPSAEVVERLHSLGTFCAVTATTVAEAQAVQAVGADAVALQGIEAGGHQGTHRDDPQADGRGVGLGLLTLVTQVREAVQVPLIAAGGLMRGNQIAAVLAAGAAAAQLGTAYLVCPESGADPLHKQALTNPVYPRTELTRAFTGRPARGLANRFLREHGPYAPAAYPQVHHLTSGLRKAAARAGDAQGMALWAGQGHRLVRELPAGQLTEVLLAELSVVREAFVGRGSSGAGAAGFAGGAAHAAGATQGGPPEAVGPLGHQEAPDHPGAGHESGYPQGHDVHEVGGQASSAYGNEGAHSAGYDPAYDNSGYGTGDSLAAGGVHGEPGGGFGDDEGVQR